MAIVSILMSVGTIIMYFFLSLLYKNKANM